MSRSRLVLSFLLALSTTTSAFAADGPPHFARPPARPIAAADVTAHVVDAPALAPPATSSADPVPEASRPAVTAVSLDRAAIRARLLANRRANVRRFHAYRVRGIYPSNVFTAGALNVWRDPDNHLCAAATIIDASGEHALVQQTANDNNFIRLADVTDSPLMDWMLTSGLTQEELVAIQKPFMGVRQPVEPVRPQIVANPAKPVVDPGVDPSLADPSLANPQPALVDPTLRKAETTRLAKLYRRVEAQLLARQTQSLELAVDRLMQHPELAARLLSSTSAPASSTSRPSSRS
ncbi:MAG TPA: hypothetical protein VFQ53_33055 [Kofleriaceae bacterium]|nr:hypothetical protein [Kofleriaceae bacterium]